MSGPLIFDARDQEIARLRRRIEALEEKLSATEKTLSANLKRVDGKLELLLDDYSAVTDFTGEWLLDVANRVVQLEVKVFPNLPRDLRELRKVIGEPKDGDDYKLDRRPPRKSD